MSTLDRPRPTATAASPSALAPLSDSALANLIADGGDGAFEVLYERYRPDLSRYCRALLRNPEDAEEAFQGTMLNALRALRGGDGGRNMRPWLYRIAHNQCASMIRARRPSSALSPDQPSPADLPEDQVALAEQIRHLRTDLGSLPALQRSALVMREMSGLSHRAIAQALSVEPADARQLVYEARRSLDECRIGREAGCSDLRAQIADGDRRRLRSRRVRAHLRTCDDCTAYVASQDERRRGYAALAPAMPATAGRQVFDRVMGSSGAGAATGGAAVVGVPGGVAGTIAGIAAGLSPANSARAWARLPEGTATGLAGAGATAGIALLSLALTALLLSGDNAAHGSAAGPPAPDRSSAPLEVAVAAPPGAASIGYRATFADPAPAATPAADAGTGSPSDAVDEPAPTNPISIAIERAVIEERPAPTPPPDDPEPSFEAGFEIVDLPAAEPQRPDPSSPRPRVVDPAPPAEPPAPAAPVTTTVVEAPADAEPPASFAVGSEDPEPASVAEAPVDLELAVPDAVGSAPDPEPIADPARDGVDVFTADAEVGSVPDPEPVAVPPDPEVGSVPDPEPASLTGEGEATDGVEDFAVRDESDGDDPRDEDSEDAEAPDSEPEVGSVPDPEPEPGSTSSDEIAFDGEFAVDCPVDPAT